MLTKVFCLGLCVYAFVADEEPCVNVRCSDMGQAEMYFVDDNMLD